MIAKVISELKFASGLKTVFFQINCPVFTLYQTQVNNFTIVILRAQNLNLGILMEQLMGQVSRKTFETISLQINLNPQMTTAIIIFCIPVFKTKEQFWTYDLKSLMKVYMYLYNVYNHNHIHVQ